MSYVTWETRLYKRTEDEGWETTYTTHNDIFAKMIKVGLGTKIDTFSFKAQNNYNKRFSPAITFANGDKVEFYAKLNSTSIVSSDLLFVGIIQDVTEQMGTQNLLTINGASFTEQLLKGLTFITDSTALTPPAILEQSLLFHNENNENFTLTWKSTNPTSQRGNDPDNPTGTPFPTHYVADFYKPMNVIFERYSSNQYTEDGNYYYYVNTSNELVWDKKYDISVLSLDETECQTIKLSNKGDETINSLIVYCGTDPEGKGIKVPVYDNASRVKYGAKWKYVTQTNSIAKTIMQYEKDYHVGTSTFEDEGGNWYPQSYNYVTTFGVTTTSNNHYTKTIRAEAKRRGKIEGEAFLDGIRTERISAKVTLPFNPSYTIASVVKCNFPTYGLTETNLRITNITHTDYTTTLDLFEDELNVES